MCIIQLSPGQVNTCRVLWLFGMLTYMTARQKEELLCLARSLIGKPYERAVTLEDAPEKFDCSSFTQYLFSTIGIKIPRSSVQQAGETDGKIIDPTIDPSFLETGDLLFMRSSRGHYHDELFGGKQIYIGHVVVYAGNGMVIHSKKSAGGVTEQPLSELARDPDYKIVFIRRF